MPHVHSEITPDLTCKAPEPACRACLADPVTRKPCVPRNRENSAETSGITETERTPTRDHRDAANEEPHPIFFPCRQGHAIKTRHARCVAIPGFMPGPHLYPSQHILAHPRPSEPPDPQKTRRGNSTTQTCLIPSPAAPVVLLWNSTREGRHHRHGTSQPRASCHFLLRRGYTHPFGVALCITQHQRC